MRGARRADIEARKFVGGRRASSVFSSPVRGILDATRRKGSGSFCKRERGQARKGPGSFFRLDTLPGERDLVEWPRHVGSLITGAIIGRVDIGP